VSDFTVQRLRVLPRLFAVEHRPDARMPADDTWLALVRAPEGLTVVRETTADADGEPWVALYSGETAHAVEVPGVLAALLVPIAAAGIPVFVASTFQADLILVPLARQADAVMAIRSAGHEVTVG
jgi:hypothetical protein